MNREQYEGFIADLEREARENPARYRLKLGGMATLGYAYVGGVLALLCGVLFMLGWMLVHRSATAIAIKLGIVVVPLVWAVLQAMFVRMSPPSGRELSRKAAPALFDFVDEIRLAANAPRVHRILITGELNAAVVQHPRLGIFGWARNYLILGLPMLQALTLPEFRAVVAHEFGHLSGAHGKFGAWIYRLRVGWAKLTHALEQSEHWGRFLFVPFFKWYAPAFAAYSFVQARRQEYEADRVSAAVAGPDAAASALVRVEVQARFLDDEYWRRIFNEAAAMDRPQAQPFASMHQAFVQHKATGADKSLAAALRVRTGCDDTHPSLSDRLTALGATATLPALLSQSAAEVLLGSLHLQLADDLDKQWRESVSGWWQNKHQELSKLRTRLDELNASAVTGELSVDDAFEHAVVTERLGDNPAAMVLFEQIIGRQGDHAPSLFELGHLQLEADDEAGMSLLRQAARFDADCTAQADALIVNFLHRHGRNEEARPYIDRLHDASVEEEAAGKERSTLLTSDTLLPHALPPDVLATVAMQLQQSVEVRRAWIARKQTRYRQRLPVFMIAIQRQARWWKFESAGGAQRLLGQLAEAIELPGYFMVIAVEREAKGLQKKFRKVPEALVYEAK